MKRKKSNTNLYEKCTWLHFYLLLFATIAIILIGCKKDQNSPKSPIISKSPIIFNPNMTYGSLTDQDGNTYKTIQIGTQTWMAENLRTTKYRNGVPIPEVTNKWKDLTTGAYCNYNNDTSLVSIYGRLYNWYAVKDNRSLAPTGWHIPSNAEWATLSSYLIGESFAGGKLKEQGSTHWSRPNKGATNETGFTALPGGLNGNVDAQDQFSGIGLEGYWWTTNENSLGGAAYSYCLYYYYPSSNPFAHPYLGQTNGFSVRCLKD